MLGLGIVQLLEAGDKSIRTKREVEIYLGAPTLGVISHMGNREKIRHLTSAGGPTKPWGLAASSWKQGNV